MENGDYKRYSSGPRGDILLEDYSTHVALKSRRQRSSAHQQVAPRSRRLFIAQSQ